MKISLSPMTRVEGHLDVTVTVETVDGRQQVVSARCAGTNFRGFEQILAGRDPRDATHYTQRICGVCPIAHGMASSKTLESAFGIAPTDNGRIMRNLVLGANFVHSHLLHFYHLAVLDYVNTSNVLDMSPWKPRLAAPDMLGGATAQALVGHYVQALTMRRKAHQMAAIFGGRMPCSTNFVPGGSTETVSAQSISDFRGLLTELRTFVNDVYLPDMQALVDRFPAYKQIGRGCGNLLAYGVFDLNADGSQKLLARGRYTGGSYASVDQGQIREYVSRSWYSAECSDRAPASGLTVPAPGKNGAYSWVKAPRYAGAVHEVGPLARMWVNNNYRAGISVIDRLAARAAETKKVADAMSGWLDQLQVGQPVYRHAATPASATGVGLTEAPRGALGHWLGIEGAKIAHYQVVTPTGWNASPADDTDQPGAMEQALLGTEVRNWSEPIEVYRVVHSFDPCLACAVHMVRPGRQARLHAVIS